MSFTSDVRAESARTVSSDICCARSELNAAFLASGISFLGRDRYQLAIRTEDAPVARHYFTLLKRHFDLSAEIRTLKAGGLNDRMRYEVLVPEEHALKLLKELRLYNPRGMFGLNTAPDEEILRFGCCKAAFLKSAFLLLGQVSNPERGYHLEFACPSEDFANSVLKLLQYFEITAGNVNRKARDVVYLKSAEQISDVLTVIGAMSAVLKLENVLVTKEVRNHINRQINCDTSNINRAVQSATERIEDIRYIDDMIGLDALPKALKDIALARIDNPETPLSGLGDLLEPPIGKSGVNARLRRLKEIADKLRSGEEVEL